MGHPWGQWGPYLPRPYPKFFLTYIFGYLQWSCNTPWWPFLLWILNLQNITPATGAWRSGLHCLFFKNRRKSLKTQKIWEQTIVKIQIEKPDKCSNHFARDTCLKNFILSSTGHAVIWPLINICCTFSRKSVMLETICVLPQRRESKL